MDAYITADVVDALIDGVNLLKDIQVTPGDISLLKKSYDSIDKVLQNNNIEKINESKLEELLELRDGLLYPLLCLLSKQKV